MPKKKFLKNVDYKHIINLVYKIINCEPAETYLVRDVLGKYVYYPEVPYGENLILEIYILSTRNTVDVAIELFPWISNKNGEKLNNSGTLCILRNNEWKIEFLLSSQWKITQFGEVIEKEKFIDFLMMIALVGYKI